MERINGKDGHTYELNESLGMIIQDGVVMSTEDYEPVYYISGDKAVFSGVLNKRQNLIISMTGDIGPVTNQNTI